MICYDLFIGCWLLWSRLKKRHGFIMFSSATMGWRDMRNNFGFWIGRRWCRWLWFVMIGLVSYEDWWSRITTRNRFIMFSFATMGWREKGGNLGFWIGRRLRRWLWFFMIGLVSYGDWWFRITSRNRFIMFSSATMGWRDRGSNFGFWIGRRLRWWLWLVMIGLVSYGDWWFRITTRYRFIMFSSATMGCRDSGSNFGFWIGRRWLWFVMIGLVSYEDWWSRITTRNRFIMFSFATMSWRDRGLILNFEFWIG
jgi:hypothetical protein